MARAVPVAYIFDMDQAPSAGAPNPPELQRDRQERLRGESILIAQARSSAAAGLSVPLAEVIAWVESWDTDHELPQPLASSGV